LSDATVRVALVVAAAQNGVIGRGGKLPWRLSGDLKLFRRLTLGKPVIMGRKTYESIGKPLDKRDNIVVSRDPSFSAAGVLVFSSVDAALAQATTLARQRGVDEVCIIGGAEIYRATLGVADRIYLTRVKASPQGDAYFPEPDPKMWRESAREPIARGPSDPYEAELVVLDRSQQGCGPTSAC
jgi:dihydrofolate reductase